GLRLIGYDRPGYGGSTPQPGRTVADCASDVRAICAGLGIDRLAMWGVSGGGPHVLACAALLPDLVTAAGPVRPVRPRAVARRPYPWRGRPAAGRRRPPHAGDQPRGRGTRLAGGSP